MRDLKMKLDSDIKKMSFGERGKELQRLRNLIRTHKVKKDNARCYMADDELYDKTLPEGGEGAGKMTLPREVLLVQCDRYIRQQQKRNEPSNKQLGFSIIDRLLIICQYNAHVKNTITKSWTKARAVFSLGSN